MGRRARGRRGALNVQGVGCGSSDVFCQTATESLDSHSFVRAENFKESEALINLLDSLKNESKNRASAFVELVIKVLESSDLIETKTNDWFMKVLETLEEHYEVTRSERDRTVEEYEENLMICRTEVAESNKLLQDVSSKLYASKAEVASLRRLVRNYLLSHESKLDYQQREKLDLHHCINDQKVSVTQISNDCASMQLEIERLKDANSSLESEMLRLKTENKDLADKLFMVNAHIVCESGSSHASSQQRDSDEIMEHICALQAEKHVLECKNSSNEKTIKYLRQQLSGKTLNTENSLRTLARDLTENQKILEYYKDKVREQEKTYYEVLWQLDSSKNIISSLNAEVMMYSKLNQELLQNKNSSIKELNFCLSNLKQLNSSLEDVEQGHNVEKLTPVLLALQFGFSCPTAECFAIELKRLLTHLQKFMNLCYSLAQNFDVNSRSSPKNVVMNTSCGVHRQPNISSSSHVLSESVYKTTNEGNWNRKL